MEAAAFKSFHQERFRSPLWLTVLFTLTFSVEM